MRSTTSFSTAESLADNSNRNASNHDIHAQKQGTPDVRICHPAAIVRMEEKGRWEV